jgi:hypothetical protein
MTMNVPLRWFRRFGSTQEMIRQTALRTAVLVHEQIHVDIVFLRMLTEDRRNIHRHRTVNKNRQLGGTAGGLQFTNPPDQFLSSAESERGNNDRSVSCVSVNNSGPSVEKGIPWMAAVAVRGFDK